MTDGRTCGTCEYEHHHEASAACDGCHGGGWRPKGFEASTARCPGGDDVRDRISNAIDSFPGLLHSEKITAALSALRPGDEIGEYVLVPKTLEQPVYAITAIAGAAARDAGKRFWLYWSHEAGGWWQWGPEAWAERFPTQSGPRFDDALRCAPKVGPYWACPDPSTIEVVAIAAAKKG